MIAKKIFFYGLLPLLLQRKAAIFHGALLGNGEYGVILSAPGGTGKTTCASRASGNWQALSDDAVLIVKSENDNGKFIARGMPTWSQFFKSGDFLPVNWSREVRLANFFQLRRGEKDEVKSLDKLSQRAVLIKSAFDFCNIFGKERNPAIFREISNAIVDLTADINGTLAPAALFFTLNGKYLEAIEAYEDK